MKILNLSLHNFRQFDKKELDLDSKWSVLTAPNAGGKSTIIEAVHLLTSGTSPWNSNNKQLIKFLKDQQTEKSKHEKLKQSVCRIESEIETQDTIRKLALVLQGGSGSITKQYQIEGNSTSRSKFLQDMHSIIFSPDLIDNLMFEPRKRRNFLDDQISKTNLDYEQIASNYSKVLRQRNSLLKSLAAQNGRNGGRGRSRSATNGNSLEYWTEQLITLGTQVMRARIEFIDQVNEIQSDKYSAIIKYEPRVKMDEIEELADNEYIEKRFRDQLAASRRKEAVLATTLMGPHRDDWYLADQDIDLNTYGSRGQKRMAIIDILLKVNEVMTSGMGAQPVLLLDDIASELDEKNIEILFKEKIPKQQQIIVTTTHLEMLPDWISEDSEVIRL